MALLDPVRDSKGQILLPAGVELVEGHIAQLLQRGINAVSVAVLETEEERKERFGKEKEWILGLFGEVGESTELEQLRRLLLEHTDAS